VVADDIAHHAIVVFALERAGHHVGSVVVAARELFLRIRFDKSYPLVRPDVQRVGDQVRVGPGDVAGGADNIVHLVIVGVDGLVDLEQLNAGERWRCAFELLGRPQHSVNLVWLESQAFVVRDFLAGIRANVRLRDIAARNVHAAVAIEHAVVWLRSLGLGKYEAAFRENEITDKVPPNLTAEDLKELGVAALGHRRTLLDAIAALRNNASVQTLPVAAPAQPSAATPASAPIAEAAGERRHVTVMFCDLVGSTSISAGLDAEDWRDLVGSYLDAASAAVTEMGGHVAKKLGDGLMALFGYPVAQENDAERAARAALSIQRSLAEVNRKNAGSGKPALNARIGIETGPVVVDAAGEIYGDAPNTAARVQALAEPGMVVVTARVQRQNRGSLCRRGARQP
jgi:class 3 adenylate cyclase